MITDDGLEATPRQVRIAAFAEMVNAEAPSASSASFFCPPRRQSRPGVYYLKHVQFLGAVPPAVRVCANRRLTSPTPRVGGSRDFLSLLQRATIVPDAPNTRPAARVDPLNFAPRK